jgi:hypothetical protein
MDENNFEYNGMKFYAEEISEDDYIDLDRDVCTGCYFDNGDVCDFDIFSDDRTMCCSDDRKDGRNVIFKKAEG